MSKKKAKTAGDYLLNFLLFLALVVFLFAGYKLYTIYQQYKVGTDEYKAIEEMAVKERPSRPSESGEQSLPQTVEPPITVDFAALQAVNEDVVGWLYMEALDISYPIVLGEDNEQYLHTTYEGTYNFAGSIFLDYENAGDFKDTNTIVYGHNMKNGSMFGRLHEIVTENVGADNPYFWIFTPEHNYRYEIFAAYTTSVDSYTYTLFEKHGKEYEEYLEQMQDNSEVDRSQAEPKVTQNTVTLSTCTGDTSTRFVVQGIQQVIP